MSEKVMINYPKAILKYEINEYFQKIKRMFSRQRLINHNKNDHRERIFSSFDGKHHRVFKKYSDLTTKQIKDKTIQRTISLKQAKDKQVQNVQERCESIDMKKINMRLQAPILQEQKQKLKHKRKSSIVKSSKNKLFAIRNISINDNPYHKSQQLAIRKSRLLQLKPLASKIQRFNTESIRKKIVKEQEPEQKQKGGQQLVNMSDIRIVEDEEQYELHCSAKRTKTTILRKQAYKHKLEYRKNNEPVLNDIRKFLNQKPYNRSTPGTIGPWNRGEEIFQGPQKLI